MNYLDIIYISIIAIILGSIVLLGFYHQAYGFNYNETCNLVQCYICGPLDENVCILGDKK